MSTLEQQLREAMSQRGRDLPAAPHGAAQRALHGARRTQRRFVSAVAGAATLTVIGCAVVATNALEASPSTIAAASAGSPSTPNATASPASPAMPLGYVVPHPASDGEPAPRLRAVTMPTELTDARLRLTADLLAPIAGHGWARSFTLSPTSPSGQVTAPGPSAATVPATAGVDPSTASINASVIDKGTYPEATAAGDGTPRVEQRTVQGAVVEVYQYPHVVTLRFDAGPLLVEVVGTGTATVDEVAAVANALRGLPRP